MEYLSSGLAVTVIGISIVMIVLIMIAFAISLFKFIGTEKKKEEDKPAVKSEPVSVLTPEQDEADGNEEEIVAAVMAAVSQYLQVPASGFVVRSIKKVSAWEEISRLEKQV